jgi:hypothetical protein
MGADISLLGVVDLELDLELLSKEIASRASSISAILASIFALKIRKQITEFNQFIINFMTYIKFLIKQVTLNSIYQFLKKSLGLKNWSCTACIK